MNLKTLLAPLQDSSVYGSIDREITGIAYDSRKVSKGDLFVGLPGLHFHGLQFLPQAEQAGAVAVLSDRKPDTTLPCAVVPNARLALAIISNAFYDYPSLKLKLFAVTGTNGKTTSAFLMRSVLEAAGHKSGIIGTILYGDQDFQTPASLTTPESLDLQKLLARMVDAHCTACAMEASSHSLQQSRVAGCTFETAIYTNLTQDHLDYHVTMEDYFCAKMMLFNNQTCTTRIAVVNIDDAYGDRILKEREKIKATSFSYGFAARAQYRISEWTTSSSGSRLQIEYPDGKTVIRTPLMARYNAYNICGVFTAMKAAGIQDDAIVRGIENMNQVPGRLERIDLGQPYLILIDYAHTEDALSQLLKTIRPYTSNRLIVLFGCGGERDAGKRPKMGKIAGELADEVILSSDNPRKEDPAAIIEQVKKGVEESGNSHLRTFIDRKEAIRYAVSMARKGDALVLAGKGHENYQIIGDKKLHFDEREILKEFLSR
jgi:UDP-N-acetylmuramoyl-L-alanyl-D-glutamate--2,6-diaminopimelate ligase